MISMKCTLLVEMEQLGLLYSTEDIVILFSYFHARTNLLINGFNYLYTTNYNWVPLNNILWLSLVL